MKIEGTLTRSGKWWAVEITMLALNSQGKSKKDALEMAQDAVECLADMEGFEVSAYASGGDTFVISANDDALLMALILKQLRHKHKLSIGETAKRLGAKSRNTYAQYERGRIRPSLDKFSQMIKAITGNEEPVLKLG